MISVGFQGKPFNTTVIQVYAPTSNAEEAEVEQFYEDLQDFLELIPPKDILFIIGDWNAKVGSQEIHGVTGKFSLGIQNEATHSSVLAWRIPGTGEPGGLPSWGHEESDTTETLSLSLLSHSKCLE